MAARVESMKAELLARVVRMARERLDAPQAAEAERLIRAYYANVSPDDLLGREPESLYGAVMGLRGLARCRQPGQVKVRVYNPRVEEHGWQSEHSVVEIVNDDMPFLVDSVTAALQRLDRTVHLVIHPILAVRRDPAGKLLAFCEIGEPGAALESFMHIEINRVSEARVEAETAARLEEVLAEVRAAVADWQPMKERLNLVEAALAAAPPGISAAEAAEARDFLGWLREDHFTFLGYRCLSFAGDGSIDLDPASGRGLMRDPADRIFDEARDLNAMPAEVQAFLRRPHVLLITKSNRAANVHRPVPMDIIGVKAFDDDGRVAGIHLFVGLFASAAYTRSPSAIPVLRRKIAETIARAGFLPSSHDGKALLHILEHYPRDELFQISSESLFDTAMGILRLQERQRVALFVRRDEFDRFVSCLVFVPRDRFDTQFRLGTQALLEQAFAGTMSAYYTQVGDSPLARLHFYIRTPGGIPHDVDVGAVERRIAEAARSWDDRLQEALLLTHGEERGLRLFRRYVGGFPGSYREAYSPQVAVFDLDRLDQALAAAGAMAMNLFSPVEAAEPEARLKLYSGSRPLPLSDVLPVLENLGFRVISEVPHQIRAANGATAWIHDFALVTASGAAVEVGALRDRFKAAFMRVWRGEAENDGFNRLVVVAGLDWREVATLRAYAKYLRQAGATFGQSYVERTLAANAPAAALLARLFHARFDPAAPAGGEAALRDELGRVLDGVASAEDDRILRRFLNLVLSTLRTNYYQRDAAGEAKPYLSFKLDSGLVEDLPLPRPWREIFVYSPRVEAVHLRGGKVARGGIRWSDRREDFRTEVLGLLKAQMVKNAVIVPVGSKGGFVVKRPPAEGGRDAIQAEAIECYRMMMRGLLDLTDNIRAGAVVAPPDVVRHDGDDPYLVVAADKGTASFSDIANAISLEYGHWLGDAFASGGSHGYDHKTMGITARGAWVSVQRHFRELGIDVQASEVTCVGVGDMSGDVFGNGLLRSPHTRLVGAFNHLHIFVDPDPDPARSFAERGRLFRLARSAWSDYDPAALSPGGAVYRRDAKTVALSPQARARFGLDREVVTPAELVRAMLTAAVDLLWFGGIGTYVKASKESHAAVGDRANDAVRVDAHALRARVVGEGANLALTQLGRIEYALRGGRLNTDAIDNSAGVDTSDHEVNIKILLDAQLLGGDLTAKQRNELLTAMTDEVAALVLRDNYLQTQAISLMAASSAEQLDRYERFMRMLEKAGRLHRAVEFLPDDDTIAERAALKRGLTRPELAILLAYGKIWLFERLAESDLPDDPLLAEEAARYFPAVLRQRFAAGIAAHPLRREIVATSVTNSLINRVGPTFVAETAERTGLPAAEVARAYIVVRDAFHLRALWDGIEALDNRVPAAAQLAMLAEINRLVDRGIAWVLRHAAPPLDMAALRAELEPVVAALAGLLPAILPADAGQAVRGRADEFAAEGVPAELAWRVASSVALASASDIGRIAGRAGLSVEQAAALYFAVGARFALGWLRLRAQHAAPAGASAYWHKLALAAIIDELYGLQRDITLSVAEAASGPAAESGPEPAIQAWLVRHRAAVERADQLLADLRAAPAIDLAVLTVANRQLRGLIETARRAV